MIFIKCFYLEKRMQSAQHLALVCANTHLLEWACLRHSQHFFLLILYVYINCATQMTRFETEVVEWTHPSGQWVKPPWTSRSCKKDEKPDKLVLFKPISWYGWWRLRIAWDPDPDS